MDQYGILSIIPPLMAIGLAFATKQVLPSLFFSVWIGATIMSDWNPVAGFAKLTVKYVVGSVADPWNAAIIVISITLGGMVGVISKSGGMKAIADSLGKKAKSDRGAQVVSYFMGMVIFFDDYANTLLVGNTMRPLSDRMKVSREKLAYICDSTAAPVASIAPFSTWTAYQMGLIHGVFKTIDVDMNIYEAFLRSVPYSFYGNFALIFVFLIAFWGRDFGPMLSAERRARKTGKLLADGAVPLASKELTEMEIKEGVPLRWYNAAIPILSVIVFLVIGLYIDGYSTIMKSGNASLIATLKDAPLSILAIASVVGEARVDHSLMWGVFSGTLVSLGMVVSQRILGLAEAMDAWVDGAKSMVTALLIIVFAWGIGSLCKDLGTAAYLVGILQNWMSAAFIPPLVFIVACIIAFSTGTAYGTMAIVMPIAVPLGFHLSGDTVSGVMFATIGATLTGSVFGDHCSPISDTTIMSSMASASDHLDHVKTQAPYAMAAAAIAIVFGFIPAGFGVNPIISLVTGGIATAVLIRLVGKKV